MTSSEERTLRGRSWLPQLVQVTGGLTSCAEDAAIFEALRLVAAQEFSGELEGFLVLAHSRKSVAGGSHEIQHRSAMY